MTPKLKEKLELKELFWCKSTGEEHDVLLNMPPWISALINAGWVSWWCDSHRQFSVGPAKSIDPHKGQPGS